MPATTKKAKRPATRKTMTAGERQMLVMISKMDWALLRRQKAWLLDHAMSGKAEAEGLVNMVDVIQDGAVDLLGIPEHEVFG